MLDVVDMTTYNWEEKNLPSTGTTGVYFKIVRDESDGRYYYKLSNFDEYRDFVGLEAANEVIASRLGNILGLSVVQNEPVYVKISINRKEYTTLACKSLCYKEKSDERISAKELFDLNREDNETPLETFLRLGFSDLLDIIFVWDYLIIGKDRHSSNVEFLSKNDGSICPAPLFDNGISFLSPKIELDMSNIEYMLEGIYELDTRQIGNNFFGERSLFYNLNFMTNSVKVSKLKREHKYIIFKDLEEIIPSCCIEKIWSIICYRYSFLRKRKCIIEKDDGL